MGTAASSVGGGRLHGDSRRFDHARPARRLGDHRLPAGAGGRARRPLWGAGRVGRRRTGAGGRRAVAGPPGHGPGRRAPRPGGRAAGGPGGDPGPRGAGPALAPGGGRRRARGGGRALPAAPPGADRRRPRRRVPLGAAGHAHRPGAPARPRHPPGQRRVPREPAHRRRRPPRGPAGAAAGRRPARARRPRRPPVGRQPRPGAGRRASVPLRRRRPGRRRAGGGARAGRVGLGRGTLTGRAAGPRPPPATVRPAMSDHPHPPGTVPPRPSRWLLPLIGVLTIVALVASLLLVRGASSGEEVLEPPGERDAAEEPDEPPTQEELEEVVAEISAFVEQETGLSFLEPVTVELAGEGEFQDRLLADFDEDVEDLRATEVFLKALGLVDPDVDLVESMRSLLG